MLSLYAFELPEPPSAWKTLAGMEVNGDPPIAHLPDAPVWLPDKRLLFVGASYLTAQDRWLRQAYVIDPRTRHLRPLAGTEDLPDGKTLACP